MDIKELDDDDGPKLKERYWVSIIDFHKNNNIKESFEIHGMHNYYTVLGLFKNKKNAYKQSILYEFEHNKQWLKNIDKIELLLSNFDEIFDTNESKFIQLWISLREKSLKPSTYGLSTGYRFIIHETNVID